MDKKIEKWYLGEYGDEIAFYDELKYETSFFSHKIKTPFGEIVVLQTSPQHKGMKAIVFWNYTKNKDKQ